MIRLLFLLLAPFINCDRIVQTNTGPVRGISIDTKNVEAFLGIPYAEPPVGKLRFARPVAKSPWTETFDATQLPPACVQSLFEHDFFNESSKIDEDCLYLNLWVPQSENKEKPIMLFIHGGGFMTGSSNMKIYDGANLSQHGDVIVASINYRVGTLGFFSAFIDEAAGSMGMYDQVLAIQWIKDNAKHFGGNPNNIVIFGESAGAFSVSLHMVSPLSKNLFNRAIAQSGAAVHPMYSNDNELLRMHSQTISKSLGCSANAEDLEKNPKKVVECMKNLPSEKFSEADKIVFNGLGMFVPRVGDEFLPISPTDMFRKGEFKDTEVLLGVTKDEGTMFVAFLLSGNFIGESFDADAFNESLAKNVIQNFKQKNEHYDNVVQKYFQKVKDDSRYTYLNAANDILGDSLITCPTLFHADFQSFSQKYPVYFYLFDYRSPSSRFPEWTGVPHFEEVQYVFGNPLHGKFSEREEELSKDIMDMWAAFAKTGNPNIPGGLKWPKYTYEDPKYFIISIKDKIGVKPDNYRCDAWRSLFRSKIDIDVIKNIRKKTD